MNTMMDETAYSKGALKAQHTPTAPTERSPFPWKFDHFGDSFVWQEYNVTAGDDETTGHIVAYIKLPTALGNGVANGQYIETAVNNHNALVKALEAMLSYFGNDDGFVLPQGDEAAKMFRDVAESRTVLAAVKKLGSGSIPRVSN